MADVLRGKKTVNLKDLESPQGNRMKKSISENEASDVTDCGVKGPSNVSLNTKLKKDTRQRCYGNNAKRRRTQTSEDLGFQDDTEHVLRGKETVNMKDLKRLHKNVMKEIVTENKTLTVTDWGFKGVSNTLLNVKRDTGLRCYTNNAKKRMETSNGLGSQVVQNHASVELTINENIAMVHEQLEGSTKLDKGSVTYEHLQCSRKSFQVTASHEPKDGSGEVQVPISYELTEFSTNESQFSVYLESRQCSSNECTVPVNPGQTEVSANGPQLGLQLESVLHSVNELNATVSNGPTGISVDGPQVS